MMKPFVVTMGEPAGIGGELTVKAWQAREELNLPNFFVIDDVNRLRAINREISIQEISDPLETSNVFKQSLPVLHIPLSEKSIAGELNSQNSQSVIHSIERAVKSCIDGEAAGVITNPINKAVLQDVGFEYPGHTEFVADLCGNHLIPIMMLASDDLRVVPLTVHIALRDVSSTITQELIIQKAKILDRSLRQDFGFKDPHIAIAGLNPHAGEEGKMGMEEIEVISPAIQHLQDEGVNVSGPYPADTMFHAEARAQYDAAIGMYHDQALIPLKTLDFHGGVNITLGLPIIRTSPDHGTAIDIAGKGVANPSSFINAIKMAQHINQKRNKL